MKVKQLLEEQPLLASMPEKLLKKGYTVKVDEWLASHKDVIELLDAKLGKKISEQLLYLAENADKEHEMFMLRMAMKKMRAARLNTELKVSTNGNLYLTTSTPAFIINTYFSPKEKEKGQWLAAWFPVATGMRAGPILHFHSVDEVITDIKG